MGGLQGRTAVVTGSARGIGAGIVDVLSEDGARVVVADIDEQGAQAVAQRVCDRGGEAIGVAHDVTSQVSCHELVAQTRQAFGPVEILVNNAGVAQRTAFSDIDEPAWDRMLDVNLKGVYLMTRAVIDDMIQRQAGVVVNIASILGKSGNYPLFSHYVASKFGVIGLTQALAAELGPHGIRVNAVCPGDVRTPMQEDELRRTAADQGVSPDEVWNQTIALIPLGRPQLPEDMGAAVAFLASDRAHNITGEAINVSGGRLMD